MEADILKSLNFDLGNPTIKTILRYGVRQCLHLYLSNALILLSFITHWTHLCSFSFGFAGDSIELLKRATK